MTELENSRSFEGNAELAIYCVAMIRNESDIILNFLNQAVNLFNKTFVVDIQSTDGTREIIDGFSKSSNDRIVTFSCRTQERYQSALMNILARRALSEGADWVFFLDADEFLDVESREKLSEALRTHGEDEVIHLPWINLIPSEYGSFNSFNLDQIFSYRSDISAARKVAISARYALINPDFRIGEGNHDAYKTVDGLPEPDCLAFPLLHLPIRSAARLKYKMSSASRLLNSKHNTFADEGHHVRTIARRLLESSMTPALLASIASTYGVNDDISKASKARRIPQKPVLAARQLPLFARHIRSPLGELRSLDETLERDAELRWETPRFAKGALVGAEIQGSEIRIQTLPMAGDGSAFYGRYSSLDPKQADPRPELNAKALTDAIAAAFYALKPELEWSGLHPIVLALFASLHPRRYVELGVLKGTSFFAVCQASERLKLKTQCIGVDAWIDDPDAFRADAVFEDFRARLEDRFPAQHFIRASFSEALKCFDDGSIDLLHIADHHIYGAVVEDFESWLPKMSDMGTIIFRDTRVGGQYFGAWRLWEELKRKYPAYSIYRGSGLGVLYVGRKTNVVPLAIDSLSANREYATLAGLFFEQIGENASYAGALRKRIGPIQNGEGDENIERLKAFFNSEQFNHNFRAVLRRSLIKNRAKYWFWYLSDKRRRHYTKKKREAKDAIAYLDWKLRARRLESTRLYEEQKKGLADNFAAERPKKRKIAAKPLGGLFVLFGRRYVEKGSAKGLHPKIRLIIPTRGCSKWLTYFLDAYRSWGLEPTYAVDNGCEPETLRLLKENDADMIFIDADRIPNGESIMPYLSKSISEDYVLRLDDDEFPARELIQWVNSIPDSKYAFVTSWWIPRYEVAFLDGGLWSFHPKWFRTKVGSSLYENLHGGRFYRHRDVTYGKVGPHHGNFISNYVSHAPPEALLIHLDYLVRTMEERLDKIRSTEKRFKDAGWPFANHMLPEMAPREPLRLKPFDSADLAPLINELLGKVYKPTDKLTLGVDEIIAIQKDRLTLDRTHFHY